MTLKECKVDSVTMHLREDRRHINDDDIFLIKDKVDLPINLEIAPTEEMTKVALRLNPRSVCFVPEKRMEVTTEGGLDVKSNMQNLERLFNFTMSEIIFVGDEKYCEESISDCLGYFRQYFYGIGLDFKLEKASDPFFGTKAELKKFLHSLSYSARTMFFECAGATLNA